MKLGRFAGALGLLVPIVMFAGCELDEIAPEPRAEFEQEHMAVLGNTFAAGFQNGGILFRGQETSFGNLLSQIITGRELQMPLVAAPGIGSETGLSSLFVDENGDVTREPLVVEAQDLALNLTYPLPYDNLAVAGSIVNMMLNVRFGDEVGSAAFDLVLRNVALPGGGTIVEQYERLDADFTLVWVGDSEILAGLLDGQPQNTDPGADHYVRSVSEFEPDFLTLLDRIEAEGPERVAIANLMPITLIPYTRFFGTGSIPFVNRWAMDEDNDGNDDDVALVLLQAPIADCPSCYLPACGNDCRSVPAAFTLTFDELAILTDTIDDYNAVIAREAAARGWAHVDIFAGMGALSQSPTAQPVNAAFPWQVDPLTFIGEQNTASAYGLDGAHPSERGHAYIANLFLAAINDTYGTDYADVDVAAVENIAGFDRAPAATKVSGSPITPEARDGLKAMAKMMKARF